MRQTIITKFICEKTNRIFDTQEDALASEKNYEEEERKKLFRKYFPQHNPKDSIFAKHCVICDSILLKYEDSSDYGRTIRGDILLEAPSEEVFEGLYCLKCFEKLKDNLLAYIEGRTP